MEFAGSLSAFSFFLVLFYSHGSYPIIKPPALPLNISCLGKLFI